MTHAGDEELAKRVQAGDLEAFGTLVERYEGKLHAYARRFLLNQDDGKDLVQEVFLKTYTNIQSYNPNLKFSSWIYRIAHNEFINAIKKRSRDPLFFFDPDTLFPHPLAEEGASDQALQNEQRALVEKYLGDLPPKYREPVVLFYFEEMKYQEIADVLKIPPATVGVRINRARSMIKKIYETKNEFRTT